MKALDINILQNRYVENICVCGSKLYKYAGIAILLLIVMPVASFSAERPNYKELRTTLVTTLKSKYVDWDYIHQVNNFYLTTCDSLIKRRIKIDEKPIKEILSNLFSVTINNISLRTISVMSVPSLNHSFLLTIKAHQGGGLNELFLKMNFAESKILDEVFSGLPLSVDIKNTIGLREMLYEPYFISSRIKLPQYKSYQGMLLNVLANGAPDVLLTKLAENDTLYTSLVNKSAEISVKAVANVKHDRYYDVTIPFGLAIEENRITPEQIKKLSLTPPDYYTAFVNEAIRLYTSDDTAVKYYLERPIKALNKKFGNYYFIKSINDLHESPDALRYQAISSLGARQLYFILLAGTYDLTMEGSSALYTSSFLYVYKEFIKQTETEGLSKFFDDIEYYQFDEFVRNLSDYGLVDDLAVNLKGEKFAELMGQYLAELPTKALSEDEIMLDAMVMAEVLYQVRENQELKTSLISRISQIENNPLVKKNFMYLRMYRVFKGILSDQYNYESDKRYDILPVKRLQRDKVIVQVCFFYDDEDASASFSSSLATYDNKMWDKKDMGNYIVFNSKKGNEMKVFMNKPNSKQGFEAAQHNMLAAIEKEGYEVTSFIHRGHSYHLPHSLKKMTASNQFVFLGSCGGYKQVLKIFQMNPDANIIATRSVGSKLINDPMLEKINTSLVNNEDIKWDEEWKNFDAQFQTKLTKDLFAAYTAPNRYIGIKFLRKVLGY